MTWYRRQRNALVTLGIALGCIVMIALPLFLGAVIGDGFRQEAERMGAQVTQVTVTGTAGEVLLDVRARGFVQRKHNRVLWTDMAGNKQMYVVPEGATLLLVEAQRP